MLIGKKNVYEESNSEIVQGDVEYHSEILS